VIFTNNSINSDLVHGFQAFIQELLTSDTNELYIQQLEKSAETDSEGSGLGLLTMINDYSATLGWKFETTTEGDRTMTNVTTMAQIKV